MDSTSQIDKTVYTQLAVQVLEFLQRIPITSDMVVSSKIGAFVNSKMFNKEAGSIESINQVARALLTKWKNERASVLTTEAKSDKGKKELSGNDVPSVLSVSNAKRKLSP